MGLRERKKEATRCSLQDMAMRLFSKKGYDRTTVDDIALGVNVSSRTFFRYFTCKEEVLFGDWRGQIDELRAVFEQRPDDEPILASFRALITSVSEKIEADRDRYAVLHGMADENADIGNYERQQIMPAWEAMIAEVMASRLGVDPEQDPRPGIAAAVGVAVVSRAKQRWLKAGEGARLAAYLDDGFEALFELTREAAEAPPG